MSDFIAGRIDNRLVGDNAMFGGLGDPATSAGKHIEPPRHFAMQNATPPQEGNFSLHFSPEAQAVLDAGRDL